MAHCVISDGYKQTIVEVTVRLDEFEYTKDDMVSISARAKQKLHDATSVEGTSVVDLDSEISRLQNTIKESQQKIKELREMKKQLITPSRARSRDMKIHRLDALIESNLSWKKASEKCGISEGTLRDSVTMIVRGTTIKDRYDFWNGTCPRCNGTKAETEFSWMNGCWFCDGTGQGSFSKYKKGTSITNRNNHKSWDPDRP